MSKEDIQSHAEQLKSHKDKAMSFPLTVRDFMGESVQREVYIPPKIITNPNWTSEIYKGMVKWIKDFENTVDENHEVGARLVNFGQTIQFYLDTIEYCASPLMLFKGTMDTGQAVELIQHVSQISILLTKLPRQHPEIPKRRIGFQGESEAT